MTEPLFPYALCGSLRAASSNRVLLEALHDLLRSDVRLEICGLTGDLPIYNPDREGEATPAAVLALAAKVRAADGLIMASPEYAHGIPGGLKNALDWRVSRDEIPHKSVMLVPASYRGDYAFDALKEVLRTMSVRLVEESFFRINLLGKTEEERRVVLDGEDVRVTIGSHLSRSLQRVATGDAR